MDRMPSTRNNTCAYIHTHAHADRRAQDLTPTPVPIWEFRGYVKSSASPLHTSDPFYRQGQVRRVGVAAICRLASSILKKFDQKNLEDKFTGVMLAAMKGLNDVILLLIRFGGKVNLKDEVSESDIFKLLHLISG
ncbi:unnamed protein product [Protopolystoma xenopodis]|uniref:Uncharacterized protein n=1 Tax=Protopolystoma xenopodis TaxID=117903 RepID=A0A448XFH7_9PLAT|nr:unnamed protein product [Protopolystoma xenopodis]